MSGAIVLLLAAVFLLAALAKLRSQNQFGAVLQNLVPVSVAKPAALLIPLAELALAVFLLSGQSTRLAIAVSMAALAIFTFFLAVMWRQGVKGCGCFGETEDTTTTGSGIVRNLLLIALGAMAMTGAQAFSLYGPDASSFSGRITVVIGALCLWPCLVALVNRRKLIFNFSKA